MTDQTLRETVIRLAQPVVHSLGLLVWGVEIARAGRTLVRLFVDVPTAPQTDEHQAAPGVTAVSSAAGISDGFAPSDHSPDESSDTPAPAAPTSATIEQCEEISRHLALALEVEDSIPDAYVLEVSTPGLSRLFFSLDQMTRYVGDVVEARLHTPVASTDPAAHGASGAARLRRWKTRVLYLRPLPSALKATWRTKTILPCFFPGALCAGPPACIFSGRRKSRAKSLAKNPRAKMPLRARAARRPKKRPLQAKRRATLLPIMIIRPAEAGPKAALRGSTGGPCAVAGTSDFTPPRAAAGGTHES